MSEVFQHGGFSGAENKTKQNSLIPVSIFHDINLAKYTK